MKKKSFLLLIAYILVVFAVYLTSSTLTKYTQNFNSTGDFNLGSRLLVNYERGQLFRNGDLIVGKEIPVGGTGIDGTVAPIGRIETMNVGPSDELEYRFYVTNYDYKTVLNSSGKEVIVYDNDDNPVIADKNTILGQFHVSATAIISMPSHRTSYSLPCAVSYRRYVQNGENWEWTAWLDNPEDIDFDLPVYDSESIQYEFKVTVVLDKQEETFDHDDYVGSTLSILLFVDAADKE